MAETGTRIKIKRGTKSSIIDNKATLEQNEIVYSTDTFQLAIRNNDAPGGLAWQVAKDAYKIVIGFAATSTSGDYGQIIIGNEASSSSEYMVAVGAGSSIGAYAQYSTVVGPYAKVLTGTSAVPNNSAIAIGYNAQVQKYAPNSIAFGPYAKVLTGTSSTPNDGAIAIGHSAQVTSNKGIAIGSDSMASNNSISIGYGNISYAGNSISIGNNTLTSNANNSISIGNNTSTLNANNSISIGNGIENQSDNHVQLGKSNVAMTGNIGNRKIILEGDKNINVKLFDSIDSTTGLSMTDIFEANAPVGSIAELIITTNNGPLQSPGYKAYNIRVGTTGSDSGNILEATAPASSSDPSKHIKAMFLTLCKISNTDILIYQHSAFSDDHSSYTPTITLRQNFYSLTGSSTLYFTSRGYTFPSGGTSTSRFVGTNITVKLR